MKKHSMILLFVTIFLFVLPVSASAVALNEGETWEFGDYIPTEGRESVATEPIELKGNFSVDFRFTLTYNFENSTMEKSNGFFSVEVQDENGKSLIIQGVGNLDLANNNVPTDEELTLTVTRKDEKFVFKLYSENGGYIASFARKVESTDRVALILESGLKEALLGYSGVHNGEGGFFSSWYFNMKYIGIVGLVGLVLLILLNKGCKAAERTLFISKAPIQRLWWDSPRYAQLYNSVRGFLWILSGAVAVGLVIPQFGVILTDIISGGVGWKQFSMPVQGSILWIVLLTVSAAYFILFWFATACRVKCGFIGATILMLLFGIVHFWTWYFIICILFRLLIVAIVLIPILLGLDAPISYPVENKESKRASHFWSNGDDFFAVSADGIGESGGYVRDSKGNQIRLYSHNDRYMKDENGNLYRRDDG